MKYILDGVGYTINTKSFLLFNLAENFEHRPSYEELIVMFNDFECKYPGLSNADELMQVIYDVFPELGITCSCEEYDQIWDSLESAVVDRDTPYEPGELDEFMNWSVQSLNEDWDNE